MKQMSVLPFSEVQSSDWDTFCTQAVNATFLHTRRFLSYHGSRFEDASVCVICDDKMVGVMPAARYLSNSEIVCSHPGITYGGLIVTEWLTGARFLKALDTVAWHYADKGFSRLIYKVVPHIYHRRPAQEDLYALQRMGAHRLRVDLAAVIDLADCGGLSSRRVRALKKSQSAGIVVDANVENLGSFWKVLEKNLTSSHNASPVHSVEEMALLMDRFPNNISLRVAILEKDIVAGVVLFDSVRVRHCQYIGSSEIGRDKGALDAIFNSSIREASELGFRFFSFGISTEEEGKVLNEGLYTFKNEFGASGVVHEFYELTL